MEVLKPENVINTNRARLPRLRVVASFAAGFIGGACTGFQVGSIMFLQGNIMKVFVKIKVLKSQEVKCRCTYGVTLPRGYLQVAGWWERCCLHIRVGGAVFGQAPPHPLASTTDFTAITSVSLQRKPYKSIYT